MPACESAQATQTASTTLAESEHDKSADAVTMREKLKKMQDEVDGLKAAEESANKRIEMTEAAKNAKAAAKKPKIFLLPNLEAPRLQIIFL